MAVATPTDLANRLGRSLDAQEEVTAEALLADVEAVILSRVPFAVTKSDSDPNYRQLLLSVECAAVLRVLRNTSGITSESAVDYSVSFASAAASGVLELTPEEWRRLGARGVFTISPSYEPRTVSTNFGWERVWRC